MAGASTREWTYASSKLRVFRRSNDECYQELNRRS